MLSYVRFNKCTVRAHKFLLNLSCSFFKMNISIRSNSEQQNITRQVRQHEMMLYVCTMIHVNICMHDGANVSHQQ